MRFDDDVVFGEGCFWYGREVRIIVARFRLIGLDPFAVVSYYK